MRTALLRSFESPRPGGLLVDHDAHINWAKSGLLPVAQNSALLVHSTRGKCWSFAELRRMLQETGFEDVRAEPTVADRSVLTARRP